MAPVPNRDQAIIDLAKVSDYLLSRSHPVGRAKARLFNRFGFREDAPGGLAQALLSKSTRHPGPAIALEARIARAGMTGGKY